MKAHTITEWAYIKDPHWAPAWLTWYWMWWDINEQLPWCMLFADDIVPCSTRREQAERKLEEWRRAMEEWGLEISRKKTGYLGCTEHQDVEIYLQGETVKRVKTFTYLISTLTEDGELDAEVTIRVQDGRKNGKCLQCCATEEGTGKEIGGFRNANATLDVQSYDAGQDKKWKNKRDNESPRKEVEVVWACDEKCWALCMKERGGGWVMEMKVQGRRKRGRPKRRWLDKVKDDIKEKGLSADEVYDRGTWKRMSSYIYPTLKIGIRWRRITHSIYNATVRQSCQVMVITLFRSSHASADRHCRETLLSQVNQHETLLQKMTVALPQSWKTEMYLAMQTSSCGITRVRRVHRWLGAQANVIFQSHQLTKQQCCKKCSFVLKIIVNTFTKLGFRRQHWNAATRMIYTTLRRNTLHYKNSPNLQKDNTRKQRFTSNLGNNRRSICKIN